MNGPWRWIPPLLADGARQMAIDGWMLEQLAGGAPPMLRRYRWSRPTLSLGRHQSRLEPHWPALQQAGLIDLVRRPSGGRAVLHAGELTYALAWRPPSQRRQEAYGLSCRWLQAAFAGLALPLQFGTVAAAEARGRASCFASGTAADLVHANGAKRIGSAQLWRGPALLQHGSILLAPPAALWQQVFSEPPPALPPLPPGLSAGALETLLRQAAEEHLCRAPLLELPLGAC
jgi:lipoate-protein ligase A